MLLKDLHHAVVVPYTLSIFQNICHCNALTSLLERMHSIFPRFSFSSRLVIDSTAISSLWVVYISLVLTYFYSNKAVVPTSKLRRNYYLTFKLLFFFF